MNIPVSMGFLTWAYGPVVTNLGGGLKGTGVPFTLMNWKTDHTIKKRLIAITGTDTMIFNDVEKNLGNPKNLSSLRETTIINTTRVKKKITPAGVRRVRALVVLVATL